MSTNSVLSLILRWSVFGTFLGHGCLAVHFVPGWLPYLRVVGVGDRWARRLMPVIGVMDIVIGFICLLMNCCPLVYCWAFVWGFSTALMRPLAGESILQFVERTGNFLPALALLWMCTGPHFYFYLGVCATMIAALACSGVVFKTTGIMKN